MAEQTRTIWQRHWRQKTLLGR